MINPDQFIRELKSLFWENNFNQEEPELERLAHFAALIIKKNDAVNLISRKDINHIIENHIFISAYLSHFLPEKVNHFIDIGTGGGLPGIPLAIVRHSMKGILVDSTKKKIAAVNEFIDKLKLSNLSAYSDRVESSEFIAKFSNCFDLVVSRATVPLTQLITYALPLIKEKAYLAAMKGGDLHDEINIAELKHKSHIKKITVFELAYKPLNIRNEKEKKLILLELYK